MLADCHFMDKSELGKEAREEVTRESLIAISYSVPDTDPLDSKLTPDKINGVDSDSDAADGAADKFRSELISISYSDSPNIKPLNCPDP